jgi:hypothetical protein
MQATALELCGNESDASVLFDIEYRLGPTETRLG